MKEKEMKKKEERNMNASDEAMEKLARIMTDAPSIAKLAGTEWEIRALKPAVQWEIAKEACKIHSIDKATFGDIYKSFAENLPSLVRIVTLALLNDKKKIKEEYDKVYETLFWDSNPSEWGTLLYEILELQDVGFFLQIMEVTEIYRQMTLQRKKTMEERKSSSLEPSGGK